MYVNFIKETCVFIILKLKKKNHRVSYRYHHLTKKLMCVSLEQTKGNSTRVSLGKQINVYSNSITHISMLQNKDKNMWTSSIKKNLI